MVVGDAGDDLERTTYQLPTSYIGPGLLSDLDKAIQLEWIVTNGLGGYASSTATWLTTTGQSGLGHSAHS